MKVIFLDIDGVLNWAGTDDRIGGFIGLDPTRIAQFNKIIDAHPDAKIVVSSTWRRTYSHGVYEDFEGLVKLLQARGLKGEIIDHTPIKMSYVSRGGEIRMWLHDFMHQQAYVQDGGPGYEDHFGKKYPGEKIDAYVVLDDDTSGMEDYPRRAHPNSRIDAVLKNVDDDYPVLDHRSHHVVTTWDGEDPKGYGETAIEGGLQDDHVELAVRILNGQLLDVPPPPEPYRDPTWED